MISQLQEIKKLSWDEVFSLWEQNEAHQEKWQQLAKKSGFSNWKEWRMRFVEDLGLRRLSWGLFTLPDPAQTVPTFFGGPFKSWIEHFYEKGDTRERFSKLAQKKAVQSYEPVQKLIDTFPEHTTIIGVQYGDSIIVIEGMHRCTALAVAQMQQKEIHTHVQIALAAVQGELPVVGQYTN